MSTEAAVYAAMGAVVLMLAIVAVIVVVVLVDAVAIWPARPKHRRPVVARKPAGARYWVHPSVIDTEGRWVS